MPRAPLLALALVLPWVACGTASSPDATATEPTASGGTSDPTAASMTSATDSASDSSAASDPSADPTDTDPTDADSTDTDSTDTDSTDTGVAPGPAVLYRGPVVGGVIPGWNAQAPRPLAMLGRQGTDWIATLARIDADGALSENVAEEIIVWGWDDAPPLLYDGPVVGGAVPGWDAGDPIPVVMLASIDGDPAWFATLAQIGSDGGLGMNVADRIVVWGWTAADPGAPPLRYAGPVDANAVLDGWDDDDPTPLVMLGRLPVVNDWVSTLARVAADGTLSDNLATELRVWGW